MKFYDTVRNELIDRFLVRILVKADDIELHLGAELVFERPGCGKELIASLFLHYPSEKEETTHSVITHGEIRIFRKIYPRPRQNADAIGRNDPSFDKEICIFGIFKKTFSARLSALRYMAVTTEDSTGFSKAVPSP